MLTTNLAVLEQHRELTAFASTRQLTMAIGHMLLGRRLTLYLVRVVGLVAMS